MADTHVVFGGGSLGNAVARACVARGHTVKVASRSGRPAPAGASAIKVDGTDKAAVQQACTGAAVVYFCAVPAYTDWPRSLPPLQRGIVAGAGAAGARVVSAENVYPYGRTDAPLTEETPWQPTSKKGELKAQLNQELLDAHKQGTAQTALGRAPDYYGPEAVLTTVYGGRVFGHALLGKAADLFGDLNALHSFIYVDDFARGLVTLGESPAAMGAVWHLPCPPALTQKQLIDVIYQAAGHPPKARTLPAPIFMILAAFLPIMRELREMEYQWRMRFDFRSDKFMAAFPAMKITPHDVAVTETLAWYRARTHR